MYYFYFKKGLKTNYVMEDEFKNVVYEATMEKLTFFKPYKYAFTNLKTGKKEMFDIGHRISKSNGFDTGRNKEMRVVTDVHISINGVNNWEYLKNMGCKYEISMNGLKPCYTLFKDDNKIAQLNTTGSNVYKDEGVLSKIPVNGNYRVECDEKDIELVFMFCFMMARACILEGE